MRKRCFASADIVSGRMFDTRGRAFQGGEAEIVPPPRKAKSVPLDAPNLTELMTAGGDERIVLAPETRLNRYFSAPSPSAVLAYASSTANDMSPEAFAHVGRLGIGGGLSGEEYRKALDRLRGRIRAAYALGAEVDIVFAPSGTDLEYVALACAQGRGAAGTHNILLGADEVGSGCIHSARGRYFAGATGLGTATRPGDPVPGLGDTQIDVTDVPVRDAQGLVRPSAEVARAVDDAAAAARAQERHVLLHVVHGSKTGLVLPSLDDVDRLRAAHGDRMTIVVDACQARINTSAIGAYLDRGAIVLLTGSKFMGGPPFSGFALVPPRFRSEAPPLPPGLGTIFRRGEWPEGWPGAERLPGGANPGLLLRLEAAIFELERVKRLPVEEIRRIVFAFHRGVRTEIVDASPARRVPPYPPGESETAENHPIAMRTLSTLDLTAFAVGGASIDDATRWHAALVRHGVRLGQPVKCVKLPDGRWGATLRIGLSMPLISARGGLSEEALARSFADDMARIRAALVAVTAQPAGGQ
jgi:hypothetical protein